MGALAEEFAGDVAVPTIAPVAAISGVSGIAGIPRVARVPDVAEVAEPLVENHPVVQLSDVEPTQLVHMRPSYLPHRSAVHLVDIPAPDEADCAAALLVDVLSHSKNASRVTGRRMNAGYARSVPRVLVIGPGDMGARIMAGLSCAAGVSELVLAGVPAAAGEEAVGIVRSTSDIATRFVEADCTEQSVVDELLADSKPDVIVQCASLMSPWALTGRTDEVALAFASAGLVVALPMQLPVIRAVMAAVRGTGCTAPVANLSFPDVTNVILDRLGLAPTIGLGNVTMQLLRVRDALSAETLVRVVGHHNQVYPVMRAEPPDDPDQRVRVFLGEEGERADHLAYLGEPLAPGVIYNETTAIACIEVIEALLPGAGPTRTCAPAPFGLPGGYPVVIEDGTISLDLPPGQELDEVSAWQSAIGRNDGVDAIAADGTVTFTERAREAVANVAPWLTEPLHPDEASERAARIRELLF